MRGLEQPVPAAAGRKSARRAVCEGAGESLNIHPYRLALGCCPSRRIPAGLFVLAAKDGRTRTARPRRIPAGLLLEENPFSGSNVGMGLDPSAPLAARSA